MLQWLCGISHFITCMFEQLIIGYRRVWSLLSPGQTGHSWLHGVSWYLVTAPHILAPPVALTLGLCAQRCINFAVSK